MKRGFRVFVLVHDNGQSYEDYQEFNMGVFRTLAAAKKDSKTAQYVPNRIEEWVGTKEVKVYTVFNP